MPETKSNQRFHSLNVEQVEVLHQVLSEVVPIHGRGNFPTLELRPRDIIIAVRARLQKQGITVRDVRLNGSTASHVLVRDNGTSYKDLDIIFGVELPSQEEFQVIKESVLGCLLDCLPAGVNRERISSATMKEAYVQKMVKVFNEHDRWSLISLSNNSGKNLELKFVNALRRQFEFSVDSFQIILDRLLESYMQQGALHKRNVIKERAVEKQKNESAPHAESSADRDRSRSEGEQISQTNVKDQIHTDQLDDREHSSKTTHPNVEEDGKKETPAELRVSENSTEKFPEEESTDRNLQDRISEKKQISEKSATPVQTELRHGPELSDQITTSAEEEHSEETQPCEDQPPTRLNHQEVSVQPETSDEQGDLTQQGAEVEMPETLTATQAGKSQTAEHSVENDHEVQEWSEGDEEPVSAQHADVLLDTDQVEKERKSEEKRDIEIETGEQVQAEWSRGPESDNIQCSCISTSSLTPTPLTVTSPQPPDPQDPPEVHSPAHDDDNDSENQPHILESNSPHHTQDTLPAPPSLVSDRQTVSPSLSKSSGRLAHMVVLKHTSPKRPRKMCRKVASSLVSEREPLSLPSLDTTPCPSPEPELDLSPESGARSSDLTTTVTFTDSPGTNCESGTDLTPRLDVASSRESLTDVGSSPAVEPESLPPEPVPPQHITVTSWETRTHSQQDTSPTPVDPEEEILIKVKETTFTPGDSEPPDSEETFFSKTDSCEVQEHLFTSEAELSDEEEKTTAFTSLCPSRPLKPTVTCLTPPVLSLSPPCFSPSPPSLSPPPCLTPPSHCLSSPLQSTASQATSFGSPPLSFSPTSSCLSSPPYLTPPMVSLSPPPVCLTPPSPCLSPPLLCLTPPVESEDLVLRASPDLEPLILNTDSEEQSEAPPTQPQVSLLQVGEKMEPDLVSPMPQVAEPVSFPIAIPGSNSHALPNSQSGCPGKSDPPRSEEGPDPISENREAPEVTADTPEQTNAPSASEAVPDVEVLAESMYGDFDAAMDHLRYRLIATRNPEEIRGGGLLKYSNLLVRDYRPTSETQIKTLERYMCSRFFIDFPDVQEQQRKILSYLKNHFIGEERSKYQYLMTLRRVVDDSTVCLMGHERRQTLNMITVLALKVLGEQNIIPNTDHVTCFYQPAPYLAEHSAPYLAEPSYCSYYIPQGAGTTLLYQPYPLHLHSQTGLV